LVCSTAPKPLLLLIGYRAYGDWIFNIPILPFLFNKYRIHLETNLKGAHLFHNDPRFEGFSFMKIESYPIEWRNKVVFERWEALERELQPDRVINLWRTMEHSCIIEADQPEFYMPSQERQLAFAGNAFYDEPFFRIGMAPPANPKLDCLYYSPQEWAWGESFRKAHEGKFVIFMPIAGSTAHKIIQGMEEMTDELLRRLPKAKIYLFGERGFEGYMWKRDRVTHIFAEQLPIKQSYLATKYADLVIGPETGMLAAAGMWGTPKVYLATASSVYQLTKYSKNDYSVQSRCPCSPCEKAVYELQDCDNLVFAASIEGENYYYPRCTYMHDKEHVYGVAEMLYAKGFGRQTQERRPKERLERRTAGSLYLRNATENRLEAQQGEINAR